VKPCAAPDCTVAGDDGRLMCDLHWAKVPAGLRTAVDRTAHAWRSNRADIAAFQAHRLAVDAAVDAVDPWTVDMAAVCCCVCHRGAGDHVDAACLCTTIGPASCVKCRKPLTTHALYPDQLHGLGHSNREVTRTDNSPLPVTKAITATAHTTWTCPADLATRGPLPGVTPPGLRGHMRDDDRQLELTGAPA